MRRYGIISMILLAAVFFAVGVSDIAHASFVLYLNSLTVGGTIIIVDGDTVGGVPTAIGASTMADPDGAADGIISYSSIASGAVGGFSIQITTALSKPATGPIPMIDTTVTASTSLASGGQADTIDIWVTDTDFTAGGLSLDGLKMRASFTAPATPSGMWLEGIADFDNKEFAIGSSGPSYTTGSMGMYSGLVAVNKNVYTGTPSGPFSLTGKIRIKHTAVNQLTTGDQEISMIPEPSSLLLLGTSLIGVAGYARLRLKRRKQS